MCYGMDAAKRQGVIRMDKQVQALKERIQKADAVMIGAGAGLSTAAGFVYSGERFHRYFNDFIKRCGFQDMYSGGFYPYKTQEEFWAYLEPLYLGQPLYGRPEEHLYGSLSPCA